jgi:hypothetical protein
VIRSESELECDTEESVCFEMNPNYWIRFHQLASKIQMHSDIATHYLDEVRRHAYLIVHGVVSRR